MKLIETLGFFNEVELRAEKVKLNSGETEVLITNLLDKENYPSECFKELYFYRWNVEVGYGVMKTLLDLEKISSNKFLFIQQDIHMKLFLYNYCEMLKKAEDKLVDQMCIKCKRKHKYQVSIANLITVVQSHLIELILSCQEGLVRLYQRISKYIQSELNTIRENSHINRRKPTDSKKFIHRLMKKRIHT